MAKKEKPKSIYRDTGLGLGEFIESGGIPAAISKTIKHVTSGDRYKAGDMLSPRAKKYAEIKRTRGSYSRGGGNMNLKSTDALKGKTTPMPTDPEAHLPPPAKLANMQSKPASKPTSKSKSGKGVFSNPANVSAAKAVLPGRNPKAMDSPKVDGQMGKSNYRDMSPVTNTPPPPSKPTGGFLSSLKKTFTKKPTARSPSEYEQIMSDLQPSRKKRK